MPYPFSGKLQDVWLTETYSALDLCRCPETLGNIYISSRAFYPEHLIVITVCVCEVEWHLTLTPNIANTDMLSPPLNTNSWPVTVRKPENFKLVAVICNNLSPKGHLGGLVGSRGIEVPCRVKKVNCE